MHGGKAAAPTWVDKNAQKLGFHQKEPSYNKCGPGSQPPPPSVPTPTSTRVYLAEGNPYSRDSLTSLS